MYFNFQNRVVFLCRNGEVILNFQEGVFSEKNIYFFVKSIGAKNINFCFFKNIINSNYVTCNHILCLCILKICLSSKVSRDEI